MAPPPTADDVDHDQDSVAHSRTKRQKVDKTGRFAALQRLKQAKATGEKIKYEITDEGDVYDVVDEQQYSEIVRQRQEDDWIIDDDGNGYVEDGREIFDDDLQESDDKPSNKKKDKNEKKSKNPNIVRPGSKPKANIKNMLMAAGAKKTVKKDASIADDDILGDLMEELHSGQSQKPAAIKLKKKPPGADRSPCNPFSINKVPPRLKMPTSSKPANNSDFRPLKQIPKSRMNVSIPKLVKPKAEPIDLYEDTPVIEEPEDTMEVDSDVIDDPETQDSGSKGQTTLDEVNDIDFDEELEDESVVKDVTPNVKKETKCKIQSEIVGSGWETVLQGDTGPDNSDVIQDIQLDADHLPLVTNENGDHVFRFYWIDAYEDMYNQPGIVYLFGKVWIESAKVFVSCAVSVKNIERRVHLLPRSTKIDLKTGHDTETLVTMMDVYQEFNENVASKYKIMKFKSMKVTKQYAFEKAEVPAESDYLEIRYAADLPILPIDLKGETFSHIFGSNTSSLETLLMDRKMKGPCWLDLKCAQASSVMISWCKVEASVIRPDHVTVVKETLAAPPLVVMTLNLTTVPNPKTHQNEIVGAASLIHNSFYMDKPAPKQHFHQHFSAISKPNDCIFPFDFRDKLHKGGNNMKAEILPTERAMLGFLLAKIHKIDPDILVGHDIYGFDLDVLLHRINANKIPHWSKIGRLKRTTMPKLSTGNGNRSTFTEKAATCGRLVCDIKMSAKELIRCRSYDLTELTNHILKEKRVNLDHDEIKNMYSSSHQLLQLVEYSLVDSTYILRMMYELNVLPLALQITNICGNVMSRTLMGGRSERNEYLLLHAFHEKGFIVPDKEFRKKPAAVEFQEDEDEQTVASKKAAPGRRKPAYAGGLVLEPKKGFYDKFILLLDFNSLYPSIIQEYNICFTTIHKSQADSEETKQNIESELHVEMPDPDIEPGILPTEIRKLVESRKHVKQLMKGDISPEQYMQYDIRQKALKLTANSMYGCLGFTFSRFYAKTLAALVTGKGRELLQDLEKFHEILMKTKDLVQCMNLDVIYGDTDSIMINTNCTDLDQVFKLGNKVKSEVNKLYRLLEIDIDGVFKSLLLLKKKKYAALSIQKTSDGKYNITQELKGLDIVRRDWCDLAKEAGNFIIGQILSGESRELIIENIHSKLLEVGEKVISNEVPVEMYYINKQLTKNPEDYPDKKSLPHVQVALRLNSKGGKRLRGGDTIPYVICEDKSMLPASQRAYHPDELSKSESLKIDFKYYLSNQVHPVVSRLCDPIEGTDAAHLAECLGLDPSSYRQALRTHDDDEEALVAGAQLLEEERYKDCERFKFKCPSPTCGKETIFDNVFTGADSLIECSLTKCSNPSCTTSLFEFIPNISNQLTKTIRKHIKVYYEGWMKCDDAACNMRTKKVPLTFQRGHPICSQCQRGILIPEYSDSALYVQLCFYQYVFDFEKALNKLSEKEKSVARNKCVEFQKYYHQLKSVVDRWLRKNAYSEVNLTKLFEGLFTLK